MASIRVGPAEDPVGGPPEFINVPDGWAKKTHMSNGSRALLVVLAASAVGAAYFAYLTAVPFPPGIARLVPLVWFAACVAGWVWSIRALRAGVGRSLPVVALALNGPNTMFAAIFLLAPMTGDQCNASTVS